MTVSIGDPRFGQPVVFGNNLPLALIAGPCVVESRAHALEMGAALKEMAQRVGIGLVYKSSFDKANRTSGQTFRGIGWQAGLSALCAVKGELGLPILTDIHEGHQASYVMGAGVDCLQIPALMSRQTDLLHAAGKTQLPVNIKKGQFMKPALMAHQVDKVIARRKPPTGADVLVTERGTSFGYDDLIVDMRNFALLRSLTLCPVVFDATHSVQKQGGQGDRSGGERVHVAKLALSAVAQGLAGIFLEVHQDPDRAPSDGPNMLHLKDLESLLRKLLDHDRLAKRPDPYAST